MKAGTLKRLVPLGRASSQECCDKCHKPFDEGEAVVQKRYGSRVILLKFHPRCATPKEIHGKGEVKPSNG